MKQEVEQKLSQLTEELRKNLGGRKATIIKDVRANTPKGREQEGTFRKRFLVPVLENVFADDGLIVEGIGSQGLTQFKNNFFGGKPAVDFIVSKPGIVGEVKYQPLSPSNFGGAVGQALVYLISSKQEEAKFPYGAVIFFTTRPEITTPTSTERQFIQLLWERDNIFVIVI